MPDLFAANTSHDSKTRLFQESAFPSSSRGPSPRATQRIELDMQKVVVKTELKESSPTFADVEEGELLPENLSTSGLDFIGFPPNLRHERPSPDPELDERPYQRQKLG